MKLIQEKKEEVLKAASDGAGSADALKSRDLLTLLIKANMSEDVPEDRRLSDEDVLARECPVVVLYDLANIMHRGPNVGQPEIKLIKVHLLIHLWVDSSSLATRRRASVRHSACSHSPKRKTSSKSSATSYGM